MAKSEWHTSDIPKGEYGDSSKILEEVQELMDAEMQGNGVLALCEICDIYGALRGYVKKHHPSISMKEIRQMSKKVSRILHK